MGRSEGQCFSMPEKIPLAGGLPRALKAYCGHEIPYLELWRAHASGKIPLHRDEGRRGLYALSDDLAKIAAAFSDTAKN